VAPLPADRPSPARPASRLRRDQHWRAGLGLAGCLLILGYIRYEQNYDTWIPGHERVHQVQTTIRPPGQPVARLQASSYALFDRLGAFPQIEALTSVGGGKTVTERGGRPVFIDATVVDRSFFQVFELPFAQGSAATALPDTNSIVLTQSEAVRHFGTADVLGRTITLGAGEGKRDKRISGVCAIRRATPASRSASSPCATRPRHRPRCAAGAISTSTIM
jgi:putative ABC transport system permease protein